MKAFVYNGIEAIPSPGYRNLTITFRLGKDQSAAVKSTFKSTSSPADGTKGRKRYVGPIAHLRGKTALVEPRVGMAGQVMVQFDEAHLREARGWWQFSEADFERSGVLGNG